MAAFNRQRILDEFALGDAATTSNERGAALERIVIYVFGSIPGVRVQFHRILNNAGSEEIDVVCWNGELDYLPEVLLFECKNWADRVTSADIAVFIHKASIRHKPLAFLIAANGITGDPVDVTAAYDIIDASFVNSGFTLIVFTREELLALADTDDLLVAIQDKISNIAVRRYV